MGKKILVVDDAQTIRKLASFALTKGGYTIVEAEDGLKALEVLKENTDIDLIITDLNMPNMNGLEFSAAVKKDPSFQNIPIFMLTTEANQHIALEGKSIGIKAWMVKPFIPDKLLAAVQQVIGG